MSTRRWGRRSRPRTRIGYELAEELLAEEGLPGSNRVVDVQALVRALGIKINSLGLASSSIRGVALAGSGYRPAILLNLTSPYNISPGGRRFTLAHELCHILNDRSRAKRLAQVSGPWTLPAVEKRANAFAAMLLMPRSLLWQSLSGEELTVEGVQAAARAMQVGFATLAEHLYNLGIIHDAQRDEFRRVRA